MIDAIGIWGFAFMWVGLVAMTEHFTMKFSGRSMTKNVRAAARSILGRLKWTAFRHCSWYRRRCIVARLKEDGYPVNKPKEGIYIL